MTGAATIPEEARAGAVVRLRRIEGQVRGVRRMVEEGRDVADLLAQLAAVRAATAALGSTLVQAVARDRLRRADELASPTAEIELAVRALVAPWPTSRATASAGGAVASPVRPVARRLTGRKPRRSHERMDQAMCMSCGCMQPNDDHGDRRNITQADLERAAQAANISREQAAQNIVDCCRQMGASQGQPTQASASPSAPA